MSKEQTIIAYFPSSSKAQAAINDLSSVGLTDAHLKRTSRFGISLDSHRDSAISSAETATGLTIFSQNTSKEDNQSARILMAADPSVSGFSLGGDGLAGGHAFTVVAFVPENRTEEAVNILKQNDGEV